jgi:uncharacterized protein (DUF362 family)
MSKVSIVKTGNDIYAALDEALGDIGEKPIARGDHVLIKPNLLEPVSPDSGDITNPRVVEAVARYCLDAGANRVTIGEGPSYYQPESQLRKCFTQTGISQVAERLGIEWVLFDEHGYRTFSGAPGVPDRFRVTEFAFACDKLINLPALKTHYQTTVTLAMKNLKGCLKREDKPRFHHHDLKRSIVELNKTVRPTLNIIDATAQKVGSVGYSERKRKLGASLLIMGSDIVAVDAVGCALMGIEPSGVATVTLGAEAGLGESDLTRIDIIGEELKRLKVKMELPQEKLRQSFPLLEIIGTERACTGCFIPLLSSLFQLAEQGVRLNKPVRVCLGTDPQVAQDKACLLIGDCAQVKGGESNWVGGCPPNKEEVLRRLTALFASP